MADIARHMCQRTLTLVSRVKWHPMTWPEMSSWPYGKGATVEVIPVSLRLVAGISAIRLTLPEDLRQRHARESVGLALNELHQRFEGGAFPRIDPVADMGITDPGFLHDVVGGLRVLRTTTRLTLSRRNNEIGPVARAWVNAHTLASGTIGHHEPNSRTCVIHPEGKACSDLGLVLVLNDPPTWRSARSWSGN